MAKMGLVSAGDVKHEILMHNRERSTISTKRARASMKIATFFNDNLILLRTLMPLLCLPCNLSA